MPPAPPLAAAARSRSGGRRGTPLLGPLRLLRQWRAVEVVVQYLRAHGCGIAASPAALQEHHNRNLRIVVGRESDVPAVGIVGAVNMLRPELRCSCLARHLDPRHGSTLGPTIGYRSAHRLFFDVSVA